ncbi:conserved exported hypothetical protein [Burkholderiales bacterium 8X]|nr:conserved exported hypothetical protein [Burkholderiales bacterium 8X]
MIYRLLTVTLASLALVGLTACDPKPQPPKTQASLQVVSMPQG